MVIFTTSEKISLKSTPYFCLNPFITNLSLYLGLNLSDVYLSRNTHLHESTCLFLDNGTKFWILFSQMEFIVSSIASVTSYFPRIFIGGRFNYICVKNIRQILFEWMRGSLRLTWWDWTHWCCDVRCTREEKHQI